MIPSYPAHDLPLEELLRFAAENGITAAIDLRSSLTAGRIDIVQGQIYDAAFGGLVCEAAVCAALDSSSLQVLRGRTPPRSIARRVRSSTAEILAHWKRRHEEGSNARHSRPTWSREHPTANVRHPGSSRRSSIFRYLRLGSRLAVVLGVMGTAGYGLWSLSRDKRGSGVLEHSGREAEGSGCFELPMRRLAARTIHTVKPSRRGGSCSLLAQALIGDSGSVSGVRLQSSVDCPTALENIAIQSLLAARFEPTTCRGRLVASWAEIPIVFDHASSPTPTTVHETKLARR